MAGEVEALGANERRRSVPQLNPDASQHDWHSPSYQVVAGALSSVVEGDGGDCVGLILSEGGEPLLKGLDVVFVGGVSGVHLSGGRVEAVDG